jgi:ABC-2 type transport system ATP-binding protein
VTAPGAAGSAGDWWGTEDVCVRFGDTLALDRVWFRAEPGRVSAVVGGDGAGRTTLLRCLAGALAPASGRVRRPARMASGYMSAGSGVYPDLSVTENLAFRATAYRVPPQQARERSAELLARAGLDRVGDRLAGQLSGGMRQKLGVIAAMLHRPDLLVLDEPTTGVDPVSRADLWWLIARAAAGGAAVVLATSYLDEAERAHDVLVLDAGTVLATGTAEQIVAAMPGTLTMTRERPAGEAGRRAWRREGSWRVWDRAGLDTADAVVPGPRDVVVPGSQGAVAPGSQSAVAPGSRDAVAPDLQDAVTVAILARELALVPAGQESR